MKKVIIFDFDNTLVLSLPYWKEMIDHKTAEHYGVPENPEFEPRRHGYSNKDTAKMFLDMHGVDDSVDNLIKYWYDYMAIKYRDDIKFVNGAKEALEYLKARGYKLVLATATGKSLLDIALEVFDIERYFDYIICEEMVGKSKKDPDIYHKIMKELGADSSECFYFEDSYIATKTAVSLGIDCCAIISDLNQKREDDFAKICKGLSREYSKELFEKLGL